MSIDRNELAKRIGHFLSSYARVRPDYCAEFDDEEDQFTSPDASILFAVKTLLESHRPLPAVVSLNSSWESGGYSPYSDSAGRALHDELISLCKDLFNVDRV